MQKQMTAKYRGRCAATGRAIRPGDAIIFDTKTRAAMLAQLEPDLDPETAEAVGRYLASRETVSDTFTIGGRDYYRNKAGRCEDAPCCGCCTI